MALCDSSCSFCSGDVLDVLTFPVTQGLNITLSPTCSSTIRRLQGSLTKHGHVRQKHVAAPLLPGRSELLHRQQKPLSQVTGVVNNPVCDPEDSSEDASYS